MHLLVYAALPFHYLLLVEPHLLAQTRQEELPVVKVQVLLFDLRDLPEAVKPPILHDLRPHVPELHGQDECQVPSDHEDNYDDHEPGVELVARGFLQKEEEVEADDDQGRLVDD